MTRSRLAASALVAVALCGCDAGAPRLPLLVRAMCAIERWIERDDMRVRQEGVDRCAGAARQIEQSRRGLERALRDAAKPEPDPDPEATPPPEDGG